MFFFFLFNDTPTTEIYTLSLHDALPILVNELKVVFERMGVDVWEVIEAAKTKPFGFQAFYPGPGLGGHCIPIRSEEHTSELQSRRDLVCRLLLEKKKKKQDNMN